MAKGFGNVRGLNGATSRKAMVKDSSKITNSTPNSIAQKEEKPSELISEVISHLKDGKALSPLPFQVADVESRMKTYATANNITLGSDKLSMSPKQIQHALRDNKAEDGKTITNEEMISFPSRIGNMDLYYDSKKKNFVYTDGRAKSIIHPNYKVKSTGHYVNFITASRITNMQEFSQDKYTKIE